MVTRAQRQEQVTFPKLPGPLVPVCGRCCAEQGASARPPSSKAGVPRQCGLPLEPPAPPGGLQLTPAALGFVRSASVVLLPGPHLAVGLHQ